jgi:hypothetical protein
MPNSSPDYLSKGALKANNPIPAPDIGFNADDAFYPLRIDPSDGLIRPSYQSDVCTKRFIVCLKWEKRTLFFPELEWFYQNGFGLKKMDRP